MKNITIQFASLISTFLPYEKSKNITSFLKKSYFKSPLSPRAFNHGPGSGLSPSTKLRPRALQNTRAPGRARAGLQPWPITNFHVTMSLYNFILYYASILVSVPVNKKKRSKKNYLVLDTNSMYVLNIEGTNRGKCNLGAPHLLP